MAPLHVNMTDVEVTDFEPIPAGKYHVVITDGELKESGPNSKNPGSEYIKFELTVQEGEYENRKLWVNASMLPHALFTLKGLLDACGFETDGELDFEIDDVIGRECVVRVSVQPARTLPDGREVDAQNTVKGFYPPNERAEGASVLP